MVVLLCKNTGGLIWEEKCRAIQTVLRVDVSGIGHDLYHIKLPEEALKYFDHVQVK